MSFLFQLFCLKVCRHFVQHVFRRGWVVTSQSAAFPCCGMWSARGTGLSNTFITLKTTFTNNDFPACRESSCRASMQHIRTTAYNKTAVKKFCKTGRRNWKQNVVKSMSENAHCGCCFTGVPSRKPEYQKTYTYTHTHIPA